MKAHLGAHPGALRLNLLAAGVVAACGLAGGSFGTDAAHAASIEAGSNRNVRSMPRATPAVDHANSPNRQRARHAVPAAVPDRPAGTIVVGNCDDDGPGSLRQALAAAVNGDVIDLTGLACSTITLTSGALATSVDVTLDGPGMDALTISAGLASEVLIHVGSQVTVNGLTLAEGRNVMGIGGCTWIYGNLTMNASRVTGCAAGDGTNTSGFGAGLDVIGNLTLRDSVVSGNTAYGTVAPYGANGGGIYTGGDARLYDSVVTGNRAISTGDARAMGGGIHTIGELYSKNSVFAGNSVVAENGIARGGGMFGHGGAAVKYGSVLGNEVQSVSNTAYGGGIHSDGSVLALASTISGNTAHSAEEWSYGGGIQAGEYFGYAGPGNITLMSSTLSGNTVSSGCDCFIQGGGANAFGNIGAKYSTVSDNHAVLTGDLVGTARGGGLTTAEWHGNDTTLAVTQSTISGNSASGGNAGTGYAGGLAMIYSRLVVHNATIAFNSASTHGGGAVVMLPIGDPNQIVSTIIADNVAPDIADLALSPFSGGAVVFDGGNSLVGEVGPDITLPPDTLIGASPGLLPLAQNGGASATHALVECSPAIDAGSNPQAFEADQRGNPFVREFNGAADIGAFEWQPNLDVIFIDGFEPAPCPP